MISEYITTEKKIDKNGKAYYWETWETCNDNEEWEVIFSGRTSKQEFESRYSQSMTNKRDLVDYREHKDGTSCLIIKN